MTRLVVRATVRSQRIVAPLLLMLAVVAIACSNRPQVPGAALGAIGLLALPAHAWLASVIAASTDEPTREAFVAAIGRSRAYGAHVAAALGCCAAAELVAIAVVWASGVMTPSPSPARWVAGLAVATAGVALGTAIGIVAAPPVLYRRGQRALALVALVALVPIVLPVLSLARHCSDDANGQVISSVVPRALVCVVAAFAVVAAGLAVTLARRE